MATLRRIAARTPFRENERDRKTSPSAHSEFMS